MPARPKPPTPLPLTTQAPWRSGRGAASKDQAATARDLRRACKALGLRVTSERQTPAGTAARAKWPLLTAAHAAAESLHVATAHAAPIAPEAHRSRGSRPLPGCPLGPREDAKAACGGAPVPAQSRRVLGYPGPVVSAESASGDQFEFLAGSAQVDF